MVNYSQKQLSEIRAGFQEMKYQFMTIFGVYFMPKTVRPWVKYFLIYFPHVYLIFYQYLYVLSAYMTAGNLEVFFAIVNHSLQLIIIQLVIVNLQLQTKDMDEMLMMIGRGVYTYQGEELGPSAQQIIAKSKKNVQFVYKTYSMVMTLSVVSYVVLGELSKLSGKEPPAEGMNPDMPWPVYLPVDMRTPLGLAAGLFVLAATMTATIVGNIEMDNSSFLPMIYLRYQMELLRDSIGRLEERAAGRLAAATPASNRPDSLYQQALWLSFRENIRHHQQIIRLYNIIQKIFKNNFLVSLATASALLAVTLYLLSKFSSVSIRFKMSLVIQSVIMHIFIYCWCGQEIVNQNDELYEALYEIPWYDCNNKVKESLILMMLYVKKPLALKSSFFPYNLTLQTFNDICSTGYTYLNLIRQM